MNLLGVQFEEPLAAIHHCLYKCAGYWTKQTCATLAQAVQLSMQIANNWAIRPLMYGARPNPEQTTWKIATVANGRIGAKELWMQYDAVAKPIIAERELAEHHVTRVQRWKGFCAAHHTDSTIHGYCLIVHVQYTHLDSGTKGIDSVPCKTFAEVKAALGY